jgi:ligand-binding sensor domain-containing protein
MMRSALRICIASLAVVLAWGGASARAQEVLTNTDHVEGLLLTSDALWVATRGGLERYDLATAERTRLYTTLDGLPSNHVLAVHAREGGVLVRTARAECALEGSTFACVPAAQPWHPRIAPAEQLLGHRITASIRRGATRYVGTASAGVHVVAHGTAPRRWTPEGQICGNHVTDVVEHGGRVYVGTFADGMCVREGGGFRRLEAPFRMVNAVASTPSGLYVAATNGLFRSEHGEAFTRVHARLVADGATGLDFDGTHLWVTTPAALLRLRIRRGDPPSRTWWRPARTTAIQDLRVGPRGVAWLATEDRGVVRVDGHHVQVFDRAAGLPSSWALAVDVSRDGSALMGTLRHGLCRIRQDATLEPVPLPDPWVLRVRIDADRVYVGTQGGAFVIQDGDVHTVPHVPDPRVHEIRAIGDELWVGTEGGTLVTQRSRL